MLKPYLKKNRIEAGCDEAGRGCLAGPVVAAAVVLPPGYSNEWLNDSKQISKQNREHLRIEIEKNALAFGVGMCSVREIEKINILKASITAMHRAVKKLKVAPEFLLIDGNRFIPFEGLNHACIIKGDAQFMSIAAASILAKTYRDELMLKLHHQHPEYGWNENQGYPTKKHRDGIRKFGYTTHHRLTFKLLPDQLAFPFPNEN
jgi:ribonuclease HII